MILLVFFHLLTIQQLWHLNMAPLLYKYACPSKANDKFISILHILIFPDPGMHSVWSDAVFRTNMESFSISPRNIPRLVHAQWRLPAPVTWVLIVWTSLAFLPFFEVLNFWVQSSHVQCMKDGKITTPSIFHVGKLGILSRVRWEEEVLPRI